jgi:ribosome-binding factor A
MATLARILAQLQRQEPQRALAHALGLLHTSRPPRASGPASGQYWVPPEPELEHSYSQSLAQQRFAGRVENAMAASLLSDAVLREALVEQSAFTVHRVRVAKDRRTAYVLWDCHPRRKEACERFLQHNAFRLRKGVARLLRAKQVPYLEFRHDRLPAHKAGVMDAMMEAGAELEAQAQAQAQQEPEQDVAAALRELQAEVQLKRRFCEAEEAWGEGQEEGQEEGEEEREEPQQKPAGAA